MLTPVSGGVSTPGVPTPLIGVLTPLSDVLTPLSGVLTPPKPEKVSCRPKYTHLCDLIKKHFGQNNAILSLDLSTLAPC